MFFGGFVSTANQVIVTAQPELSPAAIAELQYIDKQLVQIDELAPGILLCDTANVALLMQRAAARLPIFARHLAPVQGIVALKNSEQDIGEIGTAIASLPTFTQLEQGTYFAVQSRFVQTDKS